MFQYLNAKADAFRARFGLPGSVLKIIAIVTMLIDHTGATVIRRLCNAKAGYFYDPEVHKMMTQLYYYSRRIGRLAFPIFCFLLVEGFYHTRSVRKYAERLALFALISEFPFDYALHPGQRFMAKQNVYWTLLIGLLVMWIVQSLFDGRIILQLAVMTSGLTLARLMQTDYSYRGVFLIEMLFIFHFMRNWQCACGAAYMEYEKMPTPLAFIPIWLYNGNRGRQLKYFFYLFYPVHLLILGIINNVILPRVL